MPRLAFTPHLARHVDCSTMTVEGQTVRQALDNAFSAHPELRGYILDDQGALRRHVAIFVEGQMLVDRVRLAEPVGPEDEIFVMQALSGG